MPNSPSSADLHALKIDRSGSSQSGFQKSNKGGTRAGMPWKSIATLVILALLIAIVAWGYPKLESRIFRTEVEVTEIALVSPAQASILLTSTGYVVPEVASNLGAQIQGQVSQVLVEEGDQVKKGDLLVVLDSGQQQSALASAKARLAAAQARAQNAMASLREIEQQASRESSLASQGVVAQASANDLQARTETLKESVRVAQAEVSAVKAEVQAQSVNLRYTEIRAPIDGTIVSKPMEVGETIGLSLESPEILQIADLNSLVVETDVPESRLNRVRIGGPAEITLDAFSSMRFRGEVKEIRPQVDRAKATVPVKVSFLDEHEGVLPNMAARVGFLDKALEESTLKEKPRLVVPDSAITKRSGATVVFVVAEDKVKMRPITLGKRFANGFVLESGPTEGTKVVSEPSPELRDGQKIKEKE